MNDIPTSITPPEFIKMIQDDSVTDQELEDLFSKIIPVNSGSEELTESQNREVMKLLKKISPSIIHNHHGQLSHFGKTTKV